MKIYIYVCLLSIPWAVHAQDFFTEPRTYNFINRIMFQSLCTFSYDPYSKPVQCPSTYEPGGLTFDPALVKEGDLVFVRSVDTYFKQVHPKIKVPYFIMSHGDCRDTFYPRYIKYLEEPNVIAWFALHPLIHGHYKFHPLPHGTFQGRNIFNQRKSLSARFKQLRSVKKDKLLYINLKVSTSRDRKRAFSQLSTKPFVTLIEKKMPFDQYMRQMAEHKFTLSPRGAGPDAYRTWEALLVGSIPIVKSSELNPLYAHLPVLVINSWAEVTEEFLEKKYNEITSRVYNIEKLYIEYWVEKIANIRKEYFAKKR